MTAGELPHFELLGPTFDTQPKAFHWAWHLARVSQRPCRVQKVGTRWRVMRRIDTTKEKASQ